MNIKKCNRCNLYLNQCPLLDDIRPCDIMWVGISSKLVTNENSIPLDKDTNTGYVLSLVEDRLKKISFYKTNLVKCVPLDCNNKIRYPNKMEMDSCIFNLLYEINVVKPKIIFLLGRKVYEYFDKYIKDNNIICNFKYYYIEHPSYIYIYKRKYIYEYIDNIINIINGK